MSDVRLRIKQGAFEIEIESTEDFVLNRLPDLVGKLIEDHGAKFASADDSLSSTPVGSSKFEQSTNTIAAMLNAKSGPDLAMAACAHLSLVQDRLKFSRKDVLDEMQSAAAFYNQNYSGNLSKILQSLMKAKKLNLVANNTFSLPKNQVEFFESMLQEA